MRPACGIAIALLLSFPAVAEQQDPAGSANSSGQTPAQPAPKENTPVEQIPTPVAPPNAQPQAAAEGAATKKTAAVSANGATKRHKRKAPPPEGTPRKIVVREGGASEPAAQIAPGMTPAEAARERQNAEQLLGSTDDRLKQLAGRTLDTRQQETVGQIRIYAGSARSALKEGDVRRAHNLAQKAHLLVEDLIKH
jgi:hypothetical protein